MFDKCWNLLLVATDRDTLDLRGYIEGDCDLDSSVHHVAWASADRWLRVATMDTLVEHRWLRVHACQSDASLQVCVIFVTVTGDAGEAEGLALRYVGGLRPGAAVGMRQGYAAALGSLPLQLLRPHAGAVLDALGDAAQASRRSPFCFQKPAVIDLPMINL